FLFLSFFYAFYVLRTVLHQAVADHKAYTVSVHRVGLHSLDIKSSSETTAIRVVIGFQCFGTHKELFEFVVAHIDNESYSGLHKLALQCSLVLIFAIGAYKIAAILGELVIHGYVSGNVIGVFSRTGSTLYLKVGTYSDF